MKVKSEDRAVYDVHANKQESENDIVNAALGILFNRLVTKGEAMCSPSTVRSFLTLKMVMLEHEVFSCMFLDAQNNLIAFEEMFRGTLTQTSVYPREIVKTALAHNAAAVIFAHNHPSGVPHPSRADESLTTTLKTALALVDVKVLDHIIIAATKSASFAELGLI